MINVYLENNYYDNATALFVRMYQDLWLLRISRLNNTREGKMTFSAKELESLDSKFKVLEYVRNCFNGGKVSMGFYSADNDFYTWAEELVSWKAKSLPKKVIKNKDDVPVTNPDYEKARITFSFRYWSCYEYNDGHSKSGKKFGDNFGFKHNLFKVPGNIGRVEIDGETRLEPCDTWSSLNDQSIDERSQALGHINCDNLTDTEIMLLNGYMTKKERMTPFLVDQDIDILPEEGKVLAYNIQEVPQGVAQYNERDVMSLMKKMIANHRWYEDARSAYHALQPWISQPSTETVESHWWVTLPRRLNIPKFGASRAMFPMLTSGDGVQVTQQAIDESSLLCSATLEHLVTSGVSNCLWFWGEYMTVFNQVDMHSMIDMLDNGIDISIKSQQRMLALISAVTDMVVPKACYDSVITCIDRGIENNLTRIVPFGYIDRTTIDKCGFNLEDDHKVIYNTVVAPGGTAIVLGLNGSLLANTPLSACFSIEAPELVKSFKGSDKKLMSFMNLWAAGTAARWQGKNLYYRIPNRSDIYVMYAANDVSIATPPVLINTDKCCGLYEIVDCVNREKTFGTNIVTSWALTKVMSWNKTPMMVLETCDRHSFSAIGNSTLMRFDSHVHIQDNKEIHYVSALLAKYDQEKGGFHVIHQRTAVPLPTNAVVSESSEADQGIPGTEESLEQTGAT
uniref:Coat protein n=1 Tax=Erysiphales associated totivirus 2 TaxID=2719849 RepID=A0A6G9EN62_9VIRU|nr:coat protein [Erysiphales associated totivirus 2]